ncbi:MAG: hypothetical protein AMXMBFR26_06910 [Porticoccaceae bacterium]
MAEIRNVSLVFGAAGEQSVAVAGDVLHVVDASGPVFVQLGHLGPWVELEKALGLKVQGGFSGVRVRSDVAQDVRLMIGAGDIIDSRTVLTGGTAVQIAGGDTVGHGSVAVSDVPVQVVAESLTRVSVLIQCICGPVFIGKDAAVTVNDGLRLDAGEALSLSVKAAVWAVAMAVGAQVRFIEELN